MNITIKRPQPINDQAYSMWLKDVIFELPQVIKAVVPSTSKLYNLS